MMKRLLALVAAIILASVADLRAAEKGPAAHGGMGVSPVASWGGKSAAQWYVDSIDKVVNLTDAQKKAITESIEARDKAMQEFQAKNAEKLKAAGTAMMEAYKSKDKDAIAKAQKVYQELYAPMHEAMKKSQGELENILTPEQKEKQQESRATAWIKAMTDPVQLTDEQMKKLKAAYGELTKATDQQAVWRKFPEAIDSVLSAEQKATIVKHRAMTYVKAMFARAKLTDAQMKTVEGMVGELAKDQNLKIVMDWQSYNKLAEKIRGLLTAEQKKAMEAPYKALQGPSKVPQGPSVGGATAPSDRPLLGGMGAANVAHVEQLLVGGKSPAQWYIDSIDKIVHLTDAQKKAITDSIEARGKAMQEFQAKNAEKLKAAGTAMMEAYKSKDKDAIAKAQKVYQELYAPMHEAMKKSQGELDNILTPEQKEKQQESRATAWIKAMTDPVQLTDEQMKKLKAAYGELTKATDQQAVWRKFPEAIDSVLSAEQKATIVKHRAMTYVKAMFARAKLTCEQMKSIEAMVDELAKDRNLKIDGQTYLKLAEKIRGLLTAEQKKALEAPYRVGAPGAGAAPGGWQVIVREGGENRAALEGRCKNLLEMASRVEHDAHELREALEQVGRQPQQRQLQMVPCQPSRVRPDPAIEELRSQVQELRREVQELKATVNKPVVKSAAQWYIDSMDKIVNLTDVQKKAITESMEARDKAMQEFQAKNADKLKAAGTAMMAAYKSKDKDAIAKAQKAYQELYAPMYQAMKKSQSELDNVLTPEQKEKQQDSRMMGMIKAWTDSVQLTDEQMKKLKAAYRGLTKATDYAVLANKFPEAVQQVLTAEQKAAIVKHRAMTYVKSMFARAKLTCEQMKSVEAMVDELAKNQDLKIPMAWQSYNKLAEKIRGLLTAEQKKTLEAAYLLGQSYIDGIDKIVNLTDAQKKAVFEKFEARDKAIREFNAQNGEKFKAAQSTMMEAFKTKDQDFIAKVQKAVQDLYAPMGEIMKKSQDALDNILTPQQKENLQSSRRTAAAKLHQAVVRLGEQAQGQAQMRMLGQPSSVRPDPAIEELRGQVQQLRREVEELKALVKQGGDKK